MENDDGMEDLGFSYDDMTIGDIDLDDDDIQISVIEIDNIVTKLEVKQAVKLGLFALYDAWNKKIVNFLPKPLVGIGRCSGYSTYAGNYGYIPYALHAFELFYMEDNEWFPIMQLLVPRSVGTQVMSREIFEDLGLFCSGGHCVLSGNGENIVDYIVPKVDGVSVVNICVEDNRSRKSYLLTPTEIMSSDCLVPFAGELIQKKIIRRYNTCESSVISNEITCNGIVIEMEDNKPVNLGDPIVSLPGTDGYIISVDHVEYKLKWKMDVDLRYDGSGKNFITSDGMVVYPAVGYRDGVIYEIEFEGRDFKVIKERNDKAEANSSTQYKDIRNAPLCNDLIRLVSSNALFISKGLMNVSDECTRVGFRELAYRFIRDKSQRGRKHVTVFDMFSFAIAKRLIIAKATIVSGMKLVFGKPYAEVNEANLDLVRANYRQVSASYLYDLLGNKGLSLSPKGVCSYLVEHYPLNFPCKLLNELIAQGFLSFLYGSISVHRSGAQKYPFNFVDYADRESITRLPLSALYEVYNAVHNEYRNNDEYDVNPMKLTIAEVLYQVRGMTSGNIEYAIAHHFGVAYCEGVPVSCDQYKIEEVYPKDLSFWLLARYTMRRYGRMRVNERVN
jgi:hypothetical protein